MSGLPVDPIIRFRAVPLKFGVGVLDEIGFELTNLDAKRVLIVTDKNVTQNTKIIEKTQSNIEEKGLTVNVWDEVQPEPSATSILKGIEFAKTVNYDCIIGIGGGSSIDTGKAMNLYTCYPADLYDYFIPPIGKGLMIPGPLKPLIAVPTTSGTGSETTGISVMTFPEKKTKYGLSSPNLIPTLAVLDPLVTLSMPPNVTANSGMDALMHAIEAYISRPYDTKPKPEKLENRSVYQGSNPITDALAEKAIDMIGRYLLRAYANGYDLEARSNMHLAASIAGLSFGNAGVHIPHALSYPIAGEIMGRQATIPHGLATTITGPATLKILAPYIKGKCLRIAKLLGEDLNEFSSPLKASEALIKMMKALNFPNGISELGFKKSDIPDLAENTLMQRRILPLSPVTVNKKLLELILEESLQYW
jgi:hydroxyacid-oxoacid transhydrogenase